MTQTYYHFTLKENVFSIMQEGLKPGDDGLIYLCTSIDDCMKFANNRIKILAAVSGLTTFDVAFIPLEIDPADVEESHDHNENFIPCKAYTYDKTIPPEKIPFLDKIPLYSFTYAENKNTKGK